MNAPMAGEVTVERLTETSRPGKRFFPDLFAIEVVVALAMLVALVIASVLTTASLGQTASRDAAGFVPRPEWYFLWLFELLKYFNGSLEVVGTTFLPVVLIVVLLAVPLLDRRQPRPRRLLGRGRPVRVVPRVIAAVVVAAILALTIVAAASNREATPVPPPPPVWPPQTHVGQTYAGAAVLPFNSELTRGSDVRVA